MKLYNFIIMVLLAFFLAIAMFLHVAHAEQDKFKAFDREYCTQIDQYEYCLAFHRLPFGPGYVGEVRLSWYDTTAITSPVDRGEMGMGHVNSRDGQTFYFEGYDLFGAFRQGNLELFRDYLMLEGR